LLTFKKEIEMKKYVIYLAYTILTMLSISSLSYAAIVGTTSVNVGTIYAYGDFGNGDVSFDIPANTITNCNGGWISPAQPGAKTLISILIAAKSSGAPVYLYVDNNSIWNGSGNNYCRIYTMGLR
jgi:hypothetical protein